MDKAARLSRDVVPEKMMIEGNINAVGMIFVAIGCLATLLFGCAPFSQFRDERKARVVTGGLAVLAYLLTAPAFLYHRCGSGQPRTQIILTSLAIGLTLAFVRSVRRRITVAVVLCLLGTTFAWQYTKLVHTKSYIGTTDLYDTEWRDQKSQPTIERLWHTSFTRLYGLNFENKPTAQPTAAASPSVGRQKVDGQ